MFSQSDESLSVPMTERLFGTRMRSFSESEGRKPRRQQLLRGAAAGAPVRGVHERGGARQRARVAPEEDDRHVAERARVEVVRRLAGTFHEAAEGLPEVDERRDGRRVRRRLDDLQAPLAGARETVGAGELLLPGLPPRRVEEKDGLSHGCAQYTIISFVLLA